MLGMGAMMGATLQAPLAALIALLELTANPNIILPGMLAIIASSMTSSHLFGHESVFLSLLKARGLDYSSNPVAQSLRRIGVASVLNVSFVETEHIISDSKASSLLTNLPHWIVVRQDNMPSVLLLAADLSRYLSEHINEESETNHEKTEINLLEIPAHREDAALITQQATLQQALDVMNDKHVDALYVTTNSSIEKPTVIGIITRQMVESEYHNIRNN